MHKSMPNSSYQLSQTDCLLHLISLYSHGIFQQCYQNHQNSKVFRNFFSHLNAPFFIWFGLFWQSLSLCSFVCCLCAFSFFFFFSKMYLHGRLKVFTRIFLHYSHFGYSCIVQFLLAKKLYALSSVCIIIYLCILFSSYII